MIVFREHLETGAKIRALERQLGLPYTPIKRTKRPVAKLALASMTLVIFPVLAVPGLLFHI